MKKLFMLLSTFLFAGCVSPSTYQVIPNELIDGRYYCLPGCKGHADKNTSCSAIDLEKELLKRENEIL